MRVKLSAKYGLGYAFIEKGVRYVIIEILTTYNSSDEIIKVSYVLEHECALGYPIKTCDVTEMRINKASIRST